MYDHILYSVHSTYCKGWAGMLPIISVSRGHFTSTDMVPVRKQGSGFGKKYPESKIQIGFNTLGLLANRSQVGLRGKPSMASFSKIEVLIPITRLILQARKVPMGSTEEILKMSNSEFKFSAIRRQRSLEQVVCWLLPLLRSAVSPAAAGVGGGERNTEENTPFHTLPHSVGFLHRQTYVTFWCVASISPRGDIVTI